MQFVILGYDEHSSAYHAGEWVGRIFVVAVVAWAIYFFLIRKRPPKIRQGTKVVTTRDVRVMGLIHWPGAQAAPFHGTLPAGVRLTAPYPLMRGAASFQVIPDDPATLTAIAFAPDDRARYSTVPLSVAVPVDGFDKSWRISV